MSDLTKKSLIYHAKPTPGKLEVVPTKPCATQEDLSMAYTPGVAEPCLAILRDAKKSYDYTMRGNTVAVVTNGTAVLGLGDIGPLASLPVMEGKCVLLRHFAGLNGVPIAVRENNVEKFVALVAKLQDNYGAINLEDIKAPECFAIEEQLQAAVDIPVSHDDQHGTAIISLAGLLNALELVGKKPADVRVVINGAGAAGVASARLYVTAGLAKRNITLLDSKGVITTKRDDLNEYKKEFAQSTQATSLQDAIKGADVFVGVSTANVLTPEMIKSMATHPIIFAMANPGPEILPDVALQAGAAIVATGRSDFPNQVNNVLGFPGIFRGALNAKAKKITTAMKLAAVEALRQLAHEPFPKYVRDALTRAYPQDAATGMFTRPRPLASDYTIPKPFDPRVVPAVAAAVAEAAIT